MLVFDTNDVSVATSLVEVVEPFGVTITGDVFSPEDPNDPNGVQVHVPIDPNDPNDCYVVPPGVDLDAAATAITDAIIPEIDSIVAQLGSITDSPQDPFVMHIEPSESGLETRVEVDYAEVLAFKGLLEGAKAGLRGLALPAYDIVINPYASPFGGSICDISYSINGILTDYAHLLKVLPTPGEPGDGPARLAQARGDVIAGIDAYAAVLSHIRSEVDPQQDDLLYIDPNASEAVDLWSDKLSALKQSLQQDTVATYPWMTTKTYDLYRSGTQIGEMAITYDPTEYSIQTGWLEIDNLSDPGAAPKLCLVEWGERYDGRLEIDFEHQSVDSWLWGTLDGTLVGGAISTASLFYTGQWDGIPVHEMATGLSGQLTGTQVVYGRVDLNPIFGGTARYPDPVNPRDLLPQFDPNNEPAPGTFGHGLGDDATLGGILPDMTQEDWMPQGYEVWGVDPNRYIPEALMYGDASDLAGCMLMGRSGGATKTFSGNYPYYLVVTLGPVRIDSLQTSDGQYYTGQIYTVNASHDGANIPGAPDSVFDTVGHYEVLGTALEPKEYTGAVVIPNTGNWTSLRVITDIQLACIPHDWNDDGFRSIIGDVPPFVQCVYFGNCPPWPQDDIVCVGDCNDDGFLSLIGDVPCFVDCVYFGNCPD